MPNSGDVVDADLGVPAGHEAGFPRPVVIITAQRFLDRSPTVVHVVPLTTNLRAIGSEVPISPEASGLRTPSSAQCQHLRSVSPSRLSAPRGNVGPVDLARIRETVAVLLDLP